MFSAPDPVSSGRPYQIVGSSVGIPDDLNRFVGEASFTIDNDGAALVVCGLGAADGTGVRFHEKDVEHSGKDVRAWLITEDPAGSFVATAMAAW
jgi:hypothetical protein